MSYQLPQFNQPPRQNVDVNPLDAELARDPQALAVWNRCAGDVNTIVTTAHARLGELVQALDERLYQINSDSRLNEGTKQQDETQARNATGQAIETLTRQAEAARDNVEQTCVKILDVSGVVRGADASATLVNLQLTRDAWDYGVVPQLRTVDVKMSGGIAQKMMNIASAAADRDDNFTLSAIRRFGEAYLIEQGHGMSHTQFVASVNVAAGASATPAMRAAMVIQQALTVSWPNIKVALQMAARYAKDKNAMRVTGLPGWVNLPGINL